MTLCFSWNLITPESDLRSWKCNDIHINILINWLSYRVSLSCASELKLSSLCKATHSFTYMRAVAKEDQRPLACTIDIFPVRRNKWLAPPLLNEYGRKPARSRARCFIMPLNSPLKVFSPLSSRSPLLDLSCMKANKARRYLSVISTSSVSPRLFPDLV